MQDSDAKQARAHKKSRDELKLQASKQTAIDQLVRPDIVIRALGAPASHAPALPIQIAFHLLSGIQVEDIQRLKVKRSELKLAVEDNVRCALTG